MIGLFGTHSDPTTNPKIGLERLGVIKVNTKCAIKVKTENNVTVILLSCIAAIVATMFAICVIFYFCVIRTNG